MVDSMITAQVPDTTLRRKLPEPPPALPNIPLLRKVWEKVSEIPTAVEALTAYREQVGCHARLWEEVFPALGISEVWDQSQWGFETSCGTSGCFAGWAVLIHDGTLKRTVDVEARAAELLGLAPGEPGALFAGDNTRDELRHSLTRIFDRAGERFDG